MHKSKKQMVRHLADSMSCAKKEGEIQYTQAKSILVGKINHLLAGLASTI